MNLKKLFRKGENRRQARGGRLRPEGVKKSYYELLEEVTLWNVENTRILQILTAKLTEERLTRWSEALSGGVRKKIRGPGNSRDLEIYREIYQFICHERTTLLTEPTMKNARKQEKTDPILLCIICGIRTMQKERGHPGLLDTIKFRLLEKEFGKK